MKIAAVRLRRVHGHLERDRPISAVYVEIETADGIVGRSGPVFREQAFIVATRLRPFLLAEGGRDASDVEGLWERMYRLDRHGHAGYMLMAVSAVDNALWDLRGKAEGAPVFRLLAGLAGGEGSRARTELPAYCSINFYPDDADGIARCAREWRDRGFVAQKYFFRHDPQDGDEGRAADVLLARTVRETLGPDAKIMFDARRTWDEEHALALVGPLEQLGPFWLEEPFLPHRRDLYARLRGACALPLAAGEHLYTRWEVAPYLEAGILSFVQSDPEWCGGITELVRIADLAAGRGVTLVPHGHGIAAAAQVVASQSESVCPMVEYLPRHLHRMQWFPQEPLVADAGRVRLPETPG
ncbi:MAG: enolase C-terminal domain-like protein, partial [Planctomycetota bacterium]